MSHRSARRAVCTCFVLIAFGCSGSDIGSDDDDESNAEPKPQADDGGVSVGGSGRDAGAQSDAGAKSKDAGASSKDATASSQDAGASADAGASEWQTLLSGEWSLPASSEGYYCVRQTVPQDVYVSAFEAINPLGTHHTFLSMGQPSGPDGVTKCTASENHNVSIFGSGVGTPPIVYPEGVAVKIEAGTQLLLNLHLFNAAAHELSGTSGTKILKVDESDVEYLGQSLAAGVYSLNLPPQQETTQAGSCTIAADTTIFGLVPHMHTLGTHMKVVAQSSLDGERVLHDAPYDFDLQLFYPIEPIHMAKGDTVQFECTWLNTTDRTVGFGDSTLDEMCFIGLYRYPTDGSSFCNLPGFR